MDHDQLIMNYDLTIEKYAEPKNLKLHVHLLHLNSL